MLYRKKGMPEEDELVLCTVTSVQYNSVFAKLDEYDKAGLIHISEVSPGRIRNIRDFVVEGKKIVCKILRVDPVKGHIDLSLRRVNEGQRRVKMEQIKQEQKAEKIIEDFAKKNKIEFNKLYSELSSKIFEKYEYIHECFHDIVEEDFDITELGIDKKNADELSAFVKEKIKPAEVEIKGYLSLVSYAPDGVNIVKSALAKAIEIGKENITIKYRGAGKYNLAIKAPDYKAAEKILKESSEAAVKYVESKKGKGEFIRI